MMKEVLLGLVVLSLAYGAPQRNRLRPDGRIVGGQVVDIKDFPYQASLNYLGSNICGAVNIAPFFMLTVAHCVILTDIKYTTVRVGSSFRTSGGVTVPVQRIHRHPYFQDSQNIHDYDIAILELTVGLGSGAGVSAVALPYQDQVFQAGTVSVVSGWGLTRSGGNEYPDELQAVNVPIVDLEECERAYHGTGSAISRRMLCTGVPQGGLAACTRDYGGPLVVEGPVLAGIASWAVGCGARQYPGVYTNVAVLRNFIKEIAHV